MNKQNIKTTKELFTLLLFEIIEEYKILIFSLLQNQKLNPHVKISFNTKVG